jgi:hypothetical protein
MFKNLIAYYTNSCIFEFIVEGIVFSPQRHKNILIMGNEYAPIPDEMNVISKN